MKSRDSAVLVFLLLGLQAGAAAQGSPDRDSDFPAKPIRILVGVPPGGSPVASVKELIAMAKAKPGALSAATAGTAGAGALTTLMFKQQTGTDFVTVPYKGGGAALNALLGGEVQFYVSSMTSSWGAIKSGKVKVLGTSSKTRLSAMPDVPTLLESGLVGLDFAPWDGLVAPAKTPRAIVDRLQLEVSRLLKLPEVLAKLSAAGSYPIGSTPDEFAAEIKRQLDVVGRVFKAEKLKRE